MATFDPKQAALHFRIWQILKTEDFKCSHAYVAEVVGVSAMTVGRVCKARGWVTRDREELMAIGSKGAAATHNHVAVDKVLLDYDNYSRLKCYSNED